MSLTIVAINHAKPKDKTYRLYDEKGLYLEVTKAGGKLWRLKYRFGGKEKRLAIGPYPEILLKDARSIRMHGALDSRPARPFDDAPVDALTCLRPAPTNQEKLQLSDACSHPCHSRSQ